MGVYIPNMSKPKECKECKFCIVEAKVEGKIYPLNAYCFVQHQNLKDFDDCPLIEIPKGYDYTVTKFIEAIQKAEDERRTDETTVGVLGDK